MKKVLFPLTLALATLASCSKDSENTTGNSTFNDPIVGSWRLTAFTSENSSTGKTTDKFNSCLAKSVYVFEANGNLVEKEYSLFQTNCSASAYPYRWKNIGKDNYLRIEDYVSSNTDGTVTTDSDEHTLIVTFSADKKTMYESWTIDSSVQKKTYTRLADIQKYDPRDEIIGTYIGTIVSTKNCSTCFPQTTKITENVTVKISKGKLNPAGSGNHSASIAINRSSPSGNFEYWVEVNDIDLLDNVTGETTQLFYHGGNQNPPEGYSIGFKGNCTQTYDSTLKKNKFKKIEFETSESFSENKYYTVQTVYNLTKQ